MSLATSLAWDFEARLTSQQILHIGDLVPQCFTRLVVDGDTP